MTAEADSLYSVDRPRLTALLPDEPRYRVEQIWRGLYVEHRTPAEMTNLPLALRERLEAALPAELALARDSVSEGGMTHKYLWRLHDGATIESVLMHSPDRSTVCVSTQAGCAMACSFCATGQAGFDRHLHAGEIVAQVVEAARRAEGRRVSNVVFMGMGEPLANYDATLTAVERIHDDLGLSARHLTISTVGVLPGIRRLATERLPVTLAVSLHAADDVLRDELVPLNRRAPLAALAEACREYLAAKGRRLSFEWAMIEDVNDTDEQAELLAAYVRPLRAHVNLIPLNPTPGYPVRGSSRTRIEEFRDLLTTRGVNATIRRTRGGDIDAACGQLRMGDADRKDSSHRSWRTAGPRVLPD
ncbi:MAG: 23S rRNA (adenine(2503)-C(2))-methyltransferase RlmN [Microthrixaceae bacterium]|nr:23S rRNA (adenine(2503)-C(2))-methyltransferase RlmN [Microthrixaceae bacterium]